MTHIAAYTDYGCGCMDCRIAGRIVALVDESAKYTADALAMDDIAARVHRLHGMLNGTIEKHCRECGSEIDEYGRCTAQCNNRLEACNA